MPRNGSGTYARAVSPYVNGTIAEAPTVNTEMNDIASALTQSLSKDGQTTPTANLPMGGNKHTSVGDAAAHNQYAAAGQVQNGEFQWCGTAGGTANALTLSPSLAITSYEAGQAFRFKSSSNANTAAATVAISGLSAVAIQNNGAALVGGEIVASQWYEILYDGAAFQLLNLSASASAPFVDTNPVVQGSADPTKKIRFEVDGLTTATTRVATIPDYDIRVGNTPAGMMMVWASTGSVPAGWLECNGQVVSRTTYAALFSAIGTTWNIGGEAGTDFRLPNAVGRSVIGAGTGSTVEAVTATSSNGFTVVSNTDKWRTGMAVVLSNLTGFTTSATAGPTYYVVVVSATNIRLATTLALAQNGAPDVTASGTGTATITCTLTARTLGENGGKESHAMTSTELLSHTHTSSFTTPGGGGISYNGNGSATPLNPNNNTGGNAAMPIMNPFIVGRWVISY